MSAESAKAFLSSWVSTVLEDVVSCLLSINPSFSLEYPSCPSSFHLSKPAAKPSIHVLQFFNFSSLENCTKVISSLLYVQCVSLYQINLTVNILYYVISSKKQANYNVLQSGFCLTFGLQQNDQKCVPIVLIPSLSLVYSHRASVSRSYILPNLSVALYFML